MCEECEDAEPLYVAYFAKAGGNLWRPPPSALPPSALTIPAPQPGFACDDVDGQDVQSLNSRDVSNQPERKPI
jgi:hypothetical protein